MSSTERKEIWGMSYVEISIIVILLCIGCVFASLIIGNLVLSRYPTAATNNSLPAHTVNDYWDNGKGTNFAYFIVTDKSLTEENAKTIITYYEDKHKGYKIINVFIFCDATYAGQKYLDDLSVTDDQFFSHVLYWYLAGEATNVGRLLQTKADGAFPTFRSACQ